MAEEITTRHNPEERRYEIRVDGVLAGEVDYRERDGALDMFHTGVDRSFGGRGLGTEVVRFALTDALERGLKVYPTCPFIDSFIVHHRDFEAVRA